MYMSKANLPMELTRVYLVFLFYVPVGAATRETSSMGRAV